MRSIIELCVGLSLCKQSTTRFDGRGNLGVVISVDVLNYAKVIGGSTLELVYPVKEVA